MAADAPKLGTVKLALIDETSGKTLVEYGGIPATVAWRLVELAEPVIAAAANGAAIKRALEGLSGVAASVQNPKKRRR